MSTFENVVLQANGLAESIADSFVLIKPIMNTLLNYNNIDGFKNLCLYIIESAICYAIVVNLMSKIYLKGAIGTTINSSKGKANNRKELELKDFKKLNKTKAYILKEIKILCRTPIFLLECIIMPIVYPVLVFLVMLFFVNFAVQTGYDLIGIFYERLEHSSGQAIFIAIGQVFYMMNFCSIIAVSRESKNAITTKYIPMKLTKQFNIKVSIGEVINAISTVLVTVCYYICTKNVFYTFMIFAILLLLNFICEKFKLLIDLRNPQISWDNEYTMMKQNTNVMYELFYTLIVVAILAIISVFISNIVLYLIFVLALCVIVNIFINRHINNKQNEIFGKIF